MNSKFCQVSQPLLVKLPVEFEGTRTFFHLFQDGSLLGSFDQFRPRSIYRVNFKTSCPDRLGSPETPQEAWVGRRSEGPVKQDRRGQKQSQAPSRQNRRHWKEAEGFTYSCLVHTEAQPQGQEGNHYPQMFIFTAQAPLLCFRFRTEEGDT